MSGHTPGEWRIDHVTRGGEICTIHSLPCSFGNGQGWAYIYGESRYPDGAEQAANARLIAASPLLLAELLEATRWMIAQQADEFGPRENWPAREQIERQEAAIAKAEGRS